MEDPFDALRAALKDAVIQAQGALNEMVKSVGKPSRPALRKALTLRREQLKIKLGQSIESGEMGRATTESLARIFAKEFRRIKEKFVQPLSAVVATLAPASLITNDPLAKKIQENVIRLGPEEAGRRTAGTKISRGANVAPVPQKRRGDVLEKGAMYRRDAISYFFITMNTNLKKTALIEKGYDIDTLQTFLINTMFQNPAYLSVQEFAEVFLVVNGRDPSSAHAGTEWYEKSKKYRDNVLNDDLSDGGHIKDWKIVCVSVEVGGQNDYVHVHTLWKIMHDSRIMVDKQKLKIYVRNAFANAGPGIPPLPIAKNGVLAAPYTNIKAFGGMDREGSIMEYILKVQTEDERRKANLWRQAFSTDRGPSSGTYDQFSVSSAGKETTDTEVIRVDTNKEK